VARGCRSPPAPWLRLSYRPGVRPNGVGPFRSPSAAVWPRRHFRTCCCEPIAETRAEGRSSWSDWEMSMSAPVNDPEPSADSTDTGAATSESCSEMVEAVEDIAATVQHGAALSEDQLQRLRGSSRRLRRAIEVRTIAGSASCRGCGEVFVRVDPEAEFCSEACRAAPTADVTVG